MGNRKKTRQLASQAASIKTSTYDQNPVGKKALFRKEKSVCWW
jgi:hypothetical protein